MQKIRNHVINKKINNIFLFPNMHTPLQLTLNVLRLFFLEGGGAKTPLPLEPLLGALFEQNFQICSQNKICMLSLNLLSYLVTFTQFYNETNTDSQIEMRPKEWGTQERHSQKAKAHLTDYFRKTNKIFRREKWTMSQIKGSEDINQTLVTNK